MAEEASDLGTDLFIGIEVGVPVLEIEVIVWQSATTVQLQRSIQLPLA